MSVVSPRATQSGDDVSEIGDLIAILGEVDRALGDEEDSRRADVAALVEPYRASDSFRWSDAFLDATNSEAMPSLEEAIGNLAQPTRFASMLPRRLLAVTLAARVLPERFGPGGDDEELSLRALANRRIIPGVDPLPTPPPDEPPDNPGLGDRTIARDEIGEGDVGIVPPVLRRGEQSFRLAIDSAEVEGSYYSGTVVARTLTAPHEVGSVPVDVIVP
jgi:hypothetical protein